MNNQQIVIVEHHQDIGQAFQAQGHTVIEPKELGLAELTEKIAALGSHVKVAINLHLRYFGAPNVVAFPGLRLAIAHWKLLPDTQYFLYTVMPDQYLPDVPLPNSNFHILPIAQFFETVTGYPFAQQ
jgi:hypothetical protein